MKELSFGDNTTSDYGKIKLGSDCSLRQEKCRNNVLNFKMLVEVDEAMPAPRSNLMAKVIQATPEVIVVLDYANSKQFNFDQGKIMTYLSTMFNSVNNR